MSENGYFDEEPIVVVPQKLPASFKLSTDDEKQQQELQQLVNQGKLRFYVVEGNRRTATVKILTDDSLRKKLKVTSDFPSASQKVVDELKVIPSKMTGKLISVSTTNRKKVLIELKSVETLQLVHKKQVLTYLRLSNLRLGLLINFGSAYIKSGIERIINGTL